MLARATYPNVLFKSSVFTSYHQLRFYSPREDDGKSDSRPTRRSFRNLDKKQRRFKTWDPNLVPFKRLPADQLTSPAFSPNEPRNLALPTFSPESLTKNMIGKATAFSITDNDPVTIFGLPKTVDLEARVQFGYLTLADVTTQFRILSQPCSVIRDVTLQTAELMQNAQGKSSRDTRSVLTGRAGCGKSFLMLQMVKHCIATGWIVIYIPQAINLINSTTPYEYDLRTRTYIQPTFSYHTLQQLQTVNRDALLRLSTTKKLVFERREVPSGTNLFDLVGVALKDPPSAPVVLDALMTELSTQTKHPVLLAVDEFQALFRRSAYRDPHFAPIRPYHLSIPRLILDFASGRRAFAKGAFLGALSASSTTYPISLELRDALDLPSPGAPPSPYDKARSRVFKEYTKGLHAVRVPEQLSIPEAAAVFEIWMKEKALVPEIYDEVFLAKYTESSGNARDFVWKGLLATLES